MTQLHTSNLTFNIQLDGPTAAPVLIFSNALGATLDMWEGQIPALSQHFRILRYDKRGHGGSDTPASPYTLDQLGQDIVDMLDALDIQRAHFCGLSIGGITGLWLGIHAPQRLDKLIICNSAAKLGTLESWRNRINLIRSEGLAPLATTTHERWFSPEFIEAHPEQVEHIRCWISRTPIEGYIGCCHALAHADLRSGIVQITAPTLLITGKYDPVISLQDTDFMARHITHARQFTLSASHLSNIEATDAFNQALLDFLI